MYSHVEWFADFSLQYKKYATLNFITRLYIFKLRVHILKSAIYNQFWERPHQFWSVQVVATKHAKRKGDQEKYPGLEDFNRFKNEPGSVQSYLHAKPIEALKYVEEDTNLAYNLIDKTADGLALLVSSITQASITELSGTILIWHAKKSLTLLVSL